MALSNSLHAEMYRRMLRIRLFEEAAVELLQRGEIAGALHTTPGQEATIVGACIPLSDQDYMVGTHRSHGHPIGKNAGLKRLMAELLGRVTGVNRGKGGSMHLADFSVGSLGETSIVGSGLPVATGAALGSKMQKNGRVTLCFFGDGASSEGTFHESLNMASIWKLPVIYFCENNGYAISTPASQTVSVKDIAIRAAGYDMPGHVVDGQDVLAVHAVMTEAVERARRGEGPSLIEAKTYRYDEHAMGLPPSNYRTAEEIERWRQRDPIKLFKAVLSEGGMNASEIDAIEAAVKTDVAEAVKFGLESPLADVAETYDHVFVDPILPLQSA
ncbi:MAG: thiamine pyrophosphate-dependent dehydrogenase E1 component subunit alpha [Caulobacterales bacterium]